MRRENCAAAEVPAAAAHSALDKALDSGRTATIHQVKSRPIQAVRVENIRFLVFPLL